MNPPNHLTSCTILWSTQGGRSKACARRTARILRDTFIACDENASIAMDSGYYGSSFDDYGALEFLKLGGGEGKSQNEHHLNGGDFKLIVLFVSTTGDGEQCDSIHETWNMLLQKSLPLDQFKGLTFALFCLGDRAYGPNAFCAAGRKLAARLVQLSAVPYCKVGYGDDGTPNGGVFRDLDSWLEGTSCGKVFYGQKTCTEGLTDVSLDVDVTAGYGPETISLNSLDDGTYTYKIHHYSGNSDIYNGNTKLTVYFGDQNSVECTAPASCASSDVWTPMEINLADGALSMVEPSGGGCSGGCAEWLTCTGAFQGGVGMTSMGLILALFAFNQ